MKQKEKIVWIFVSLVVFIVGALTILFLYILNLYRDKKILDWNEFSIQTSEDTTLKEGAILWTYAYLDQYQEKYVWWDRALEKQSVLDVQIVKENENLVLIDTLLYPRYPKFFKADKWGVIDQETGAVIYRFILKFECNENKENKKVTYSVSNKIQPVQMQLEEGRVNGIFDYEKQYYQDIAELKALEKKNPYFYQIQNENIYLTYDGHKTYVKANLKRPLSLEKEYRLEDGMYQISDKVTILADSEQIYYSDTKDGVFREIFLPVEEPIVYVHFVNEKIGYVFTMSGSALGGVIGIRILKTEDGGKNFITIPNNLGAIHNSSSFVIMKENIIFITDIKEGGNRGVLYRSEDGGKNFEIVKLPVGTFDSNLSGTTSSQSFQKVYDTPMLPVLNEDIVYLIVGQGSDGDYGNLRALYTSDDFGKNFTFVTEFIPREEG